MGDGYGVDSRKSDAEQVPSIYRSIRVACATKSLLHSSLPRDTYAKPSRFSCQGPRCSQILDQNPLTAAMTENSAATVWGRLAELGIVAALSRSLAGLS